MTAFHPIQCRCGLFRGSLAAPERAARLICYCRDCQSAAHALQASDMALDEHGGTSIVAALQSDVSVTQGISQLACMSLSSGGIYRWYASCCGTPVANTVRRPQMSYVGLVHTCLGASAHEVQKTWPRHFHVNVAHARGDVAHSRIATLAGAIGIARRVIGARLDGRWRQSPFFVPLTKAPAAPVRVLTEEERQRVRRLAAT